MTTAMDKFQREEIGADDERVLLLELHNESASGDLRTHLIRTTIVAASRVRHRHARSRVARNVEHRSIQARVYA